MTKKEKIFSLIKEEKVFMLSFRKITSTLILSLLVYPLVWPQFTPEEVSQREKWEEFLKTADIVKWEQPWAEYEAVTKPWLLTMEKNGVTAKAVWKNPQGWARGFEENWEWEIAAYRLDKLLGLNMVPPTVPRRFLFKMGSCQLYIDHMMTVKEKIENNITVPASFVEKWNKATYLQRAWDNLIANTDRHRNQFLILPGWRMILIDHSRTFRSGKKYRRELIYGKNSDQGPREMKMIPIHFYNNLKNLSFVSISKAVGSTLDKDEIKAVLLRRDLIIKKIDQRIKRLGRKQVLYKRR